MSISHTTDTAQSKPALVELFRKGPVLVEVRFPGMATSPDWFLLEDEAELEPILERLAPAAEVHLSSVWDLKNTKGDLTLRK